MGKLSTALQAAGEQRGKVFSAELWFADALVHAVPLLRLRTCPGLGENQGLFLLLGVYRGKVPDSALDLKRKILRFGVSLMILILPSAALTVRFLTRRFIGEYGDMGECRARVRPVPLRDWGQEAILLLPAGFHRFPSSPAFLQSLRLLPGGSMVVFVQSPISLL